MDFEERALAMEAIREAVEDEGYEILRLDVRGNRSVTLMLDRETRPITMDDCVFMNRRVRRALEQAHLDVDDYAVEVESPGIKRPLITLRHYERFVGEQVRLRLKEPIEERAGFKGRIVEVAEGRVKLEFEEGKVLEFAPEEVKSAKLDPEMPF